MTANTITIGDQIGALEVEPFNKNSIEFCAEDKWSGDIIYVTISKKQAKDLCDFIKEHLEFD